MANAARDLSRYNINGSEELIDEMHHAMRFVGEWDLNPG
jgi:hypothetical protein